MKRILLVAPLLVAVFAMTSCDREASDSTARTDPGSSASNSVASTETNFVRVAVIGPGTVERIRKLFVNAQIKVVLEKIVVPAGAVHEFPPDSFSIAVPEEDKPQAISLIRQDAAKREYWIQVQL